MGNRWKSIITPIHLARSAGVSRECVYRNIDILVMMYKKHPDRLAKLMPCIIAGLVLFAVPQVMAYPATSDNGNFQCGNTSPTQEVSCETNNILMFYLDEIAKSLASIAATELDNNIQLHKQTALLQDLVDNLPQKQSEPQGKCYPQGTGVICQP